MPAVKPIPDDYPRITPYLCVDGASEAIEFYSRVFGTTERLRFGGPDGRIGHAELQLGSGSPVTVTVYVEDVDAVFERALAAGARELRAVDDQFYGDRTGQFEDPFGHRWSVNTRVEDVSPAEMARRAEAASS